MIGLWWRLSRGYRLRPWRSPYLRWRMETYWGLHAESITFADFWRFVWRRRAELRRYGRWAARMRHGRGLSVGRSRPNCQPAGDGRDAAD